ncbi:hypothetical protein FE257_011918 [Aspergillus nanangensis]|uniref:Ubiquitin-like-conjugating enzyme ATG10 n=1 Tax=Aspergillus nanangensis TaxID=2582783 RepID=A0AAD4GR56_ASPNN|nr:hypothetical protein FE257_011918 [Aspergillus nanangensis]
MASSSSFSNQVPSLSTFPFLTPQEFDCACDAFVDRVIHVSNISNVGWFSVRVVHEATGPILKLSRSLDTTNIPHYSNSLSEAEDPQESQLEIREDDPEALVRTSNPGVGLQVDYDIILSPTYQVPVLYFILRQADNPIPLGIDAIYQYLVPDQYREELESVGVMGGVSSGYHPQSGAPVFFAHPCNTAEAMKHIAGQQHVTPELYLILWLGLVGSRLGLHLPRELFAKKADMEGFRGETKS